MPKHRRKRVVLSGVAASQTTAVGSGNAGLAPAAAWRTAKPGFRSLGGPPICRSYSLSGPHSTDHCRISLKIEPNGAAGIWLRDHVHGVMPSMSARRAEVSFCKRVSGRCCCSVRGLG